jgi:hypothetical protein
MIAEPGLADGNTIRGGSRATRLGKRRGLTHGVYAHRQRRCENRDVAREPRPTSSLGLTCRNAHPGFS